MPLVHKAADIAIGQAPLLPVQPKRRPAAVVPVRVELEMTPVQFARYEKLWEQIRKQRHAPTDKVEALLAIMEEYASVQTGKGELALSQAELARAQCNCQSSEPGKRNTTSVPPSVRRLVLARACHKCQRAGCNHTQFLEVHHIVPRSMGGSNDPCNCTCLCSACHGLFHEQKVGMAEFVVKEQAARYRWKSVSHAEHPAHTCMK